MSLFTSVFIHTKCQKYLVTLKDFLKISYGKMQLLGKICIFHKILLLISESEYYLQDTKMR